MTLIRTFAYLLATLVLAFGGYGVHLAVVADDRLATLQFTGMLALGLPSVGLGLLVATLRPRNVVGLLLVAIGAVAAWMAVGDLYPLAVVADPTVPVSAVYLDLARGNWMALYAFPALLFLFVPDGRLPSPRWRSVAAGLLVVPVLFMLLAAFDLQPLPAPFTGVPKAFVSGHADTLLLVGSALLPVFLGLLIATFASVIVRFRRSADEVRRAQLKWFALGASFLPATLLLCWASYLFLRGPELALVGLAATYLAIPIATTIAVLRHDLYDVDRALSATATYGLVTMVLLGFYTVASFVVGLGVGGGSPIAAAGATAVCAAALAPLRSRVQRSIDRRLYPDRQAALSAIDELRRGTDGGDAQPEQLEAVLRAALRDPALRVGYRPPGTTELVDADGRPLGAGGGPLGTGDATVIPVTLGGQVIGALVRGTTGSRELLREIAAASALLVEVVRLRTEVTRALSAAEASRARLLSAGYEERRRLERDLHDGAQQRLVALGMRLRLAQRHLGNGSVDVDGLLDDSVTELATTVAELRQIAHGLRPSSLDEGLDHALGALVSRLPVQVTLDVRADTIPEDLATTAYYVASEALTNAVKHASPAAIGVLVRREPGQLTVRVRDNGGGGAVLRPGAGLAGLADRVAAAGGRLQLLSPIGGGTLVEAVLPCGS